MTGPTSPYDPDLDTVLDDEWGPSHPEFPYSSTDSVLAWLDDGAQTGTTFDTRRRCEDAAVFVRRLVATSLHEARVRAAMRSGMPEVAAQELADKLEHRNDLDIALGLLGELIDWFGAPDWSGPIIPDELARRIAHLMERHREAPVPDTNVCTGLAARWCPIHGDCICESVGGIRNEGAGDDPLCPLHAMDSDHAGATDQ